MVAFLQFDSSWLEQGLNSLYIHLWKIDLFTYLNSVLVIKDHSGVSPCVFDLHPFVVLSMLFDKLFNFGKSVQLSSTARPDLCVGGCLSSYEDQQYGCK